MVDTPDTLLLGITNVDKYYKIYNKYEVSEGLTTYYRPNIQ